MNDAPLFSFALHATSVVRIVSVFHFGVAQPFRKVSGLLFTSPASSGRFLVHFLPCPALWEGKK
jgi:hypothetical protein